MSVAPSRLELPARGAVVESIRGLGKPTVAELLSRARSRGELMVQPRCGVGGHEAMRALLTDLEAGAAPDVLSLTIDSHTRLLKFDVAARVLRDDPTSLNGYPLVAHGWRRGLELNELVRAPLEVRHGSPDPRVLFDVSLASAITSFEGGGLCYNLPYCKDVPIRHSLECWQYVDRICGELAAESGIVVDRELFGTLTAVLVPPSISIAISLLEALLAAAEGVTCLSIAYCQSGNIVQDVAALRAIRTVCAKYLPPSVAVYAVLHEFMGVFPARRHSADAMIFFGALTAHKGGATKLINKTHEESLGIPTTGANVSGILTARSATSKLFDFIELPEERIAEEMAAIEREVDEIVAPVLGASDLIGAIAEAFAHGVLDIPFSASRHARSAVVPLRDASSAIRYHQSGGLRLSESTKRRNRALLETVVGARDFDVFARLDESINYFRSLDEGSRT